MKYLSSIRRMISARQARLIALAATSVPFVVSTSRAAYTSTDTFVGGGSPVTFSDPLEWTAASGTQALPTASQLTLLTAFNATATLSATSMVMYGISSNATGNNIIRPAGSGSITLVSTDTASDGVSTAPALQVYADVNSTASSTSMDIFVPITLGNAANPNLQVATFDNTINNGAITTEGKISEFAGSTWGLNITGTKTVQLKGSNYFSAAYAYSGDTTIAAGAVMRLFNNILPHYAGRGNLVVNGTFQESLNSNAMIINGLAGASTGVFDRSAGGAIIVGAGDASAQFDGLIKNTGLVFVKVGAGTQTFTNNTNANAGSVSIEGGVLAVTSITNAGTISALGNGQIGNAASLILDGGTLRYTGSGSSSNRLFTVNASGGGLDASGTAPLNLNNTAAAVLTDIISRPAEVNTATTATESIRMPSTTNISAGMSVIGGSLPGGTTVVSVDSSTQITVSASRPVGTLGSGQGADLLTFAAQTLDRTLTFSGTNTGVNMLSALLPDSPGGGKLSIRKEGAGTWALAGANTYTGKTTVAAGTLQLSGSAAATPILSGSGVDLQNGELVFDYTGQTSQAATIVTLLKASAATGFTAGQFRSSTTAADSSHLTALGYGEGSDLGLTLGGTPIASGFVVKRTYIGDSSLDGKVDLGNDFNLFLQGFLAHASTWEFGDYNYDGSVNTADFGMFVDGFEGQGGSLGDLDEVIESSPLLSSAQKASLFAVVPEPTLLGASGAFALAALSRRRRK